MLAKKSIFRIAEIATLKNLLFKLSREYDLQKKKNQKHTQELPLCKGNDRMINKKMTCKTNSVCTRISRYYNCELDFRQ